MIPCSDYPPTESGEVQYEYRKTQGGRKLWDGEPDLSKEGWEEYRPWERFDYHEERYWRRPRVQDVKTMGRSEGGAHTQASAEACRECPARSRTPSDLAASSSSSPSAPVSSSLVEEIWELIEDYVAYRVWPWEGPWQHAEAALRSRLTALETELNEYRKRERDWKPAERPCFQSTVNPPFSKTRDSSPNTTEKL